MCSVPESLRKRCAIGSLFLSDGASPWILRFVWLWERLLLAWSHRSGRIDRIPESAVILVTGGFPASA